MQAFQAGAAIGRQGGAQEILVVPFGRAGGDQIEAVLGQPRDRQLADHATLGVEGVAQCDPAEPGQARAE